MLKDCRVNTTLTYFSGWIQPEQGLCRACGDWGISLSRQTAVGSINHDKTSTKKNKETQNPDKRVHSSSLIVFPLWPVTLNTVSSVGIQLDARCQNPTHQVCVQRLMYRLANFIPRPTGVPSLILIKVERVAKERHTPDTSESILSSCQLQKNELLNRA